MKEFKYELVRHIADLSKDGYGYSLQMNVIAYNGGTPKLDIRRWKGDTMLKGLTLSEEEAEALYHALEEWVAK